MFRDDDPRYVSHNMPEIPYSPPIKDIFANVQWNMDTLSPVYVLLLGILFVFYVANKVKKKFFGDDD